MLLTLVATQDEGDPVEAPDLPDLYVQDAQSRQAIAVGGIEGWDADFIQTQTVSFAPMIFMAEVANMVADGITDEYWCRRLSRILVRAAFSDSGASAVIRIMMRDKNDVLSPGPTTTLTALTEQDGALYLAELGEFETLGANKVYLKVVSITAGTVNLRAAGV